MIQLIFHFVLGPCTGNGNLRVGFILHPISHIDHHSIKTLRRQEIDYLIPRLILGG